MPYPIAEILSPHHNSPPTPVGKDFLAGRIESSIRQEVHWGRRILLVNEVVQGAGAFASIIGPRTKELPFYVFAIALLKIIIILLKQVCLRTLHRWKWKDLK